MHLLPLTCHPDSAATIQQPSITILRQADRLPSVVQGATWCKADLPGEAQGARGARGRAARPAIVHSRPIPARLCRVAVYGTARRGAHVEHHHQGGSKRGEKVSLSSDLIRYIGTLRLSQGRYAGELFPLQVWQRKFIRGAFGQADDAAMSLARGGESLPSPPVLPAPRSMLTHPSSSATPAALWWRRVSRKAASFSGIC